MNWIKRMWWGRWTPVIVSMAALIAIALFWTAVLPKGWSTLACFISGLSLGPLHVEWVDRRNRRAWMRGWNPKRED